MRLKELKLRFKKGTGANGDWGLTTCPVCGMHYCSNVIEDIRSHVHYHDVYVNGVRMKNREDDYILLPQRMIPELGVFTTIIVSPTSTASQKKRAEKVARRAKLDSDFDFPAYCYAPSYKRRDILNDSPHALIGVINQRAVSLLVLARTKAFVERKWDGLNLKPCTKKDDVIYGEKRLISMVWSLPKYRNKGLVMNLIQATATFTQTPVEKLVWLVPFTDLGREFIKKVNPKIVYTTGDIY